MREVVLAEAAASGSSYGAGLTGITLSKGQNEYDPFVALGLKVEGGLAGCTEVSYKYKGAGHNFKVQLKGDEKGTLTGYNNHLKSVNGSTDWATATIPVSALQQDPTWGTIVSLNMASVSQLAWEIKGTASANYLYVDDVVCTGYTGPSSTNGNGTNGNGTNGNGTNGNGTNGNGTNGNGTNGNGTNGNGTNGNGTATDPYGSNTAIGVVAAPAGLSATVYGNTLQVTVAKAGLVKVQVFDMMGHTVESHSESMAAGSFAHTFGKMGKGAYIVRVQQGSMAKTIRMQVR